jgi:glycerol-3-phosphate dehydrogenase
MRRDVSALAEDPFDLLVLGGGITGAGVALDATLRGLRVGLIDKGDFGSGTSSASSKLVHGGLRYLEHGDVGLVREALTERGRLLRNAPHLVRRLRFVIPFVAGARVPPWQWRAGLTLYDLLAGSANIRRSRPLRPRQVLAAAPGLRPAGLAGGAEYADAWMDDARLCLAVVRTAALHGARVANYVEATAFERQAGRIAAVRAQDRLGGAELRLAARLVLNATGPWGDAVRRLAGEAGGEGMRPTKGVHLVAPGRGLPAALLLLHPDDGRVFFAIPWLNKTLIGTTDTDCPEGPDAVAVSAADVDYLLRGHNHYLDPPLRPEDLLGSFAGVRPLVVSRPGEPSARSREFRLSEGSTGLLTASGGKYTTWRSMAESITDAVMRRLGRHRHCRTRNLLLDGAPEGDWQRFAASEMARLRRIGLDEASARHLVDRYGTRAAEVAAYVEREAKLGRPVVEGEPDLLAELAHARDGEMACLPGDFLLRRTRLGLFRPGLLADPPALARRDFRPETAAGRILP